MKTESDSPVTTQPTTTTPTSTSTTVTPATTAATTTATQYASQWSTSHIPIDPALQQQSQVATATTTAYSHYQYSQHYPQAAYTHYQYAPAPITAQPQRQQTTAAQSANSGIDTADVATLNDALGSAGVDLRAEEESLHRTYDTHQPYRLFEDRARKQPVTPSFDARFLGATMRTVGTQHKVTKVPEDSVTYLALALRARLQDLVTSMITAARHRTDARHDRPVPLYEDGTPMWTVVVRNDYAKQLAALEKAEREEEMKIRRERKERAELAAAHAANLAAQASGAGAAMAVDEEDGGSKKKKKKEGPGVTARNMSEDVRKKMSNAVASQAAGIGGKYSWMTAANAPTVTPKPKAATASTTPTTTTPATTTAPAQSANTSWAKPYVSATKATMTAAQAAEADNRLVVTLRDALFAIEGERGHGGGRGAARALV